MRTGVTLQACNPVLRYCSLGSPRLVYFSLPPEVTGRSQNEANISETAKKYFELPHRSSSCWNSTEEAAEKEFFISVKAFTCRKHRCIPVRFLCLFPFHTHNTGTWLSLLENYYLIGTHYVSYHFIRF